MKKSRLWLISVLTLVMTASLVLGISLPNSQASAAPLSLQEVQSLFETENVKAFSTFGGKQQIVIEQDNVLSVTSATSTKDDTHNQTTTIKYKNPIYVGDNSDEVPFFSFSGMPFASGTRDFDAMIVTLTDKNDATNQVSVLVGFWGSNFNNLPTAYAMGSGQSYKGYHANGSGVRSLAGPVGQGTVTNFSGYRDTYYSTMSLYYDNEAKSVYTDCGWANYSSRGMTHTNQSGASLTIIRDLTDNTSSGADATAYTKGMEYAYLSVTTVRGWWAYNGIGSSNVYSNAFHGGSASGHTLSENGARYLIRSIDGLTFGVGTGDGGMADSAPVYSVADATTEDYAEIPALNVYTVLTGLNQNAGATESLYIGMVNAEGSEIGISGLNEGKWMPGCGAEDLPNGEYTVTYYSDAEKANAVASMKITVVRPEVPKLTISEVEGLFETENVKAFSTFGGQKQVVIEQDNVQAVTLSGANGKDETHNQTTTITYKNAINIGDNTDEVPFFSFSSLTQTNGKRDMDAMIVTLTDRDDPTNQVSILLGFWNNANIPGLSIAYAKGGNQSYLGYHANGSGVRSLAGPVDQGTVLAYTDYRQQNYSTLGLYYDNETKSVYTDYGWADYASRGMNHTNSAGKTLTIIRDLTDTSSNGAEGAYTQGMEYAYLTVTTVRGWYAYNGIGASNIYSSAFNGGSASAHTLSENGAKYLIRSIDGLNFSMGSDLSGMADSDPIYTAAGYISEGKVRLPVVNSYTVLTGVQENKDFTETLYVDLFDGEGNAVPVEGLNEGKWTEDAITANLPNGDYRVVYYKDQAKTKDVASAVVTVKVLLPDFDVATEESPVSKFEAEDGVRFSWDNVQVGNSDIYSGVTISTNESKTIVYNDVDISDNTKDDILFEVMFTPSEIGVFDYYYLNIKIVDAENPEKFLTLTLRKYAYDSSNLSGLLVSGENQTPYGMKYRGGVGEYDASNGGVIGFAMSGKSSGSNKFGSVKIAYDKEENAIYADNMADIPGFAIIDGFVLIRDLDETTLRINKNDDTAEDAAWSGFESGKVNIEITPTYIQENKWASFAVLTIDNERMTKRLSADLLHDGVVGYEYSIPAPTYISGLTGQTADFKNAERNGYRVLFNGEPVLVEDGKFIPTEAGEYVIEYAVKEGEGTYKTTKYVNVYAEADAPKAEFDLSGLNVSEGMVVYLGGNVNGSATAQSALHLQGQACDVEISLSKDGEILASGASLDYDCVALGDYAIVVKATDLLGIETEKEIPFKVLRTSVEFAQADYAQTLHDIANTISFSTGDVIVSDVNVVDGENVVTAQDSLVGLTVEILWAKDGGEFAPWTEEVKFDSLGDYIVKYLASYSLTDGGERYSHEAIRTVKVVDNTPAKFGDPVEVGGVKVDDTKTSTGETIYYKGLLNAEIVIAKESASDSRFGASLDLSSAITAVLTNADGVNSGADLTDGAFSFTPDKVGVYYVVYSVSDGTQSTNRTYIFDVRAIWISAAVEGELANAVYGVEYTVAAPVVSDFNGEAVENAQITVEIISGGEVIATLDGYAYIPATIGEVTVRYTAEAAGEQIVVEKILVIEDKTAPVITLESDPVTTVALGDTVVLPAITVTDDKDASLAYRLYLEFDGARTEIFDVAFVAEQLGEYKVIIEAQDLSGNLAEKVIVINVTEDGEDSSSGLHGGSSGEYVGCFGSIGAGAWLTLAGLAVVVTVIRKKKEN